MCRAWPAAFVRDQDDIAERLAADPRRVVLEEAAFAVRAGEVELLAVVESADVGDNRPDGLRAVRDTFIAEPSSDVVGQAVHPDRLVVGCRNADAVETSDNVGVPPSTGVSLFVNMERSSLLGTTTRSTTRP
jgi:hypothetical protein